MGGTMDNLAAADVLVKVRLAVLEAGALEKLGAAAVEYYRAKRIVRDELSAVHRSGKLSYSYQMPSWGRECDAARNLEIAACAFLDGSHE